MDKIKDNKNQPKEGMLKDGTYQDYNKQKPDPADPNQEKEEQGSYERATKKESEEVKNNTTLGRKENQNTDFFYKFSSMALDNERWTE